jgi:hemolysin-activating ACP:hemolysin acyltransferase
VIVLRSNQVNEALATALAMSVCLGNDHWYDRPLADFESWILRPVRLGQALLVLDDFDEHEAIAVATYGLLDENRATYLVEDRPLDEQDWRSGHSPVGGGPGDARWVRRGRSGSAQIWSKIR